MSDKKQTPSQTIGPFFASGLTPEQYGYDFKGLVNHIMVEDSKNLDIITISGQIYDGKGNTIEDAMIELWQNDGENKLFGRCGTGTLAGNRFKFQTTKPKAINGEAPFISVTLFMRGQLLHSYTRIYFSDEPELNQNDSVLNMVPEERRNTLLAKKIAGTYVFNIHMQGPNETVFLQI